MAEIGIVGGGIAGLYCAWKLPPKGHSVTVYECLNRWGGRIETQDLAGFKAECGPMRFELAIEELFSELLNDLSIKYEPFPHTRSGSAEFPKYDLQQHERSREHERAVEKVLGKDSHSETVSGIFSHHTSALDLLKFGIYRIFNRGQQDQALSLAAVVSGGKLSKISQYAGQLNNIEYDLIRTKSKLDGVLLRSLGFWNALSRVLSPGAVAKIRDTGTFYHLLPENPSASEWAIFWLRLFRPNADLSTIQGGVETIVDGLRDELNKLRNPPSLLPKHTVESINAGTGEKVALKIAGDPQLKEFDHVILAIPAVPLRSLYQPFPRRIRKYVDGVIPFALLKAFAVINDPWWEELPEPQQGAHLVPTREIHYFKPDDNSKRAMVMLYTDRPATAYWHPYIKPPHTGAQIGVERNLKHELALQIAELLPMDGTDKEAHVKRVEGSIAPFAIRDWSEAPFNAACHAWKPRLNVPKALGELKAFSLMGCNTNNVHICGEAYSDYQGFIEGALRSAKNVIDIL